MLQAAPLPGFSDLSLQSQSAFKTIMDAMARSGEISGAPEPIAAPFPFNPVAAMVALALCDYDTPIWLDQQFSNSAQASQFLAFHCGAPVVQAKSDAAFAFVSSAGKLPPLSEFCLGTDIYPDRSTTIVVQVDALTNATGEWLSGPGIKASRRFGIAPLPDMFWDWARANHALYPRGVDFIFCSASEIACLPRSTRIGKGN